MTTQSKYITLDDQNFQAEVLQSDLPVVVDFWAEWCPPCHMLAPVIEQLAEQYKGTAKVAKLDVDRAPAIAGAYGIRSIPTVLFFRGGEVVDRVVGAVPKEVIEQKLAALMTTA
jgi:thioredoxin 1